jgi:hypothetical protein
LRSLSLEIFVAQPKKDGIFNSMKKINKLELRILIVRQKEKVKR